MVWTVRLFVVLVWSLGAAVPQTVPASTVVYQCNKTSIHLVVKTDPWGTGLRLNPQYLHLGTCFPSVENPHQGLFHFQYPFKECGFVRLASGKMVEYSSNLVYTPPSNPGQFYSRPFSERINCTDYVAQRLIPSQVSSVTGQLSASSGLTFIGTIMNEDFSAPSSSNMFFLGSQIHIEFAVKSFLHRRMRVFVDECVAATTPELHQSPRNYTVIANHGCLLDSRIANSHFLPRRSPDVIHLSLQAFEFVGMDTDVYLHCQVLVWDPDILTDPTRKACSYRRDINRWENLDDPSNSVCDCCDSVCQTDQARHRREIRGSPVQTASLQLNAVIPHLMVRRPAQTVGRYEWNPNSSLAIRSHKAKVKMAVCRKAGMANIWLLLLFGMMTAQVLTKDDGFPADDSSSPPATTPEMSFFQKIFHAAKGMTWRNSPSATVTPAPPTPPAATVQAHARFLQAAHSHAVSRMNFSVRVLNEDLSVAEEPGEYVEGSTIRLEVRVQAAPGLFPKLFIDECLATDAPHHSHSSRAYIIVENHGCLYGQDLDASWFRKEDTATVFMLHVPAFLLTSESKKIYIHCFMTAWSQKIPSNAGKKACYFDSLSSRWKNVDEPSKASVCNCCDSFCPLESHPTGSVKAFPEEGKLHWVVAGPLIAHKEDVPWFEGRCHTMKKLLLVSVAFVGSSILAALLVGALLVLAVSVFRYSRTSRGLQMLKNHQEPPYQTELQTVVEALAISEEIEKESTLDYCRLKSDSPEAE